MDSYRNRRGEQGDFAFRSSRVCQENGRWYFQTRDGAVIGPFNDMRETKRALSVFVAKTIQGSRTEKVESSDPTINRGEESQHMVEELLEFFRSRNEFGEVAALAWARNRIAELRAQRVGSTSQKERIDILLYAIDED